MKAEGFGRAFLLVAALLSASATLGSTAPQAAADESVDGCVKCHSNPDFLVTNKKLYDYYQDWRASIHGQEGITCVDCHGGRAAAQTEQNAHGPHMPSSSSSSMVSFRNIPKTCGRCHDELLTAYRSSSHFGHLERSQQGDLGPNCVTCHGSLKAAAPNVNTVRATCQTCHNSISANHPEIPIRAEALLNDLNALRGYRRFISLRAAPEVAPGILRVFDAGFADLARRWHTFDLDRIESESETLLAYAREKRDLVRKERTGQQN